MFPGNQGSIMTAGFPSGADYAGDQHAIADMALLMGAVTAIRNIRGEMDIPPSKKVNVVIDAAGEPEAELLRRSVAHIQALARAAEVSIACGAKKPEASATAVFGSSQLHVILTGLLDFEEERNRLRKGIEKLQKEMKVYAGKLENKGFLEKARPEVVSEVREKARDLSGRLEKLRKNLEFFEGIHG